jgi:hypothetical protein
MVSFVNYKQISVDLAKEEQMSTGNVNDSGRVGGYDVNQLFTGSPKKQSSVGAKEGSPLPELTEFKGMSLENKIKNLSKVIPGGGKLDIEPGSKYDIKPESNTTGNILRGVLDKFSQIDKMQPKAQRALSEDQAKLLEGGFGGKLARRNNEWGKNDINANIDMISNPSPTSLSYLDRISMQSPSNLVKQERAITTTSHEILNKLYENWLKNP